MRRLAYIFSILLVSQASSAQAAKKLNDFEGKTFAGITGTLSTIRSGYSTDDPRASEAFALIDKTSDDIDHIRDLLGTYQAPKEYIRGLAQINEFLKQKIHSPEITPEDVKNLGTVQRQISIRRECADSRIRKKKKKPFEKIQVTVRTLTSDGNEVPGYDIICFPTLWPDDNDHKEPFGGQSSPTSAHGLYAGEYLFRALKSGQAKGEKTEGTCGEGEIDQTIDITVQ